MFRRWQVIGRQVFKTLKRTWNQQEWFWRKAREGANILSPVALLVCLGIMIYDLGFKPFQNNDLGLGLWIQSCVGLACLAMGVRFFLDLFMSMKTWVRVLGFLRLLFLLFLGFYLLPYK